MLSAAEHPFSVDRPAQAAEVVQCRTKGGLLYPISTELHGSRHDQDAPTLHGNRQQQCLCCEPDHSPKEGCSVRPPPLVLLDVMANLLSKWHITHTLHLL